MKTLGAVLYFTVWVLATTNVARRKGMPWWGWRP